MTPWRFWDLASGATCLQPTCPDFALLQLRPTAISLCCTCALLTCPPLGALPTTHAPRWAILPARQQKPRAPRWALAGPAWNVPHTGRAKHRPPAGRFADVEPVQIEPSPTATPSWWSPSKTEASQPPRSGPSRRDFSICLPIMR